MRQYYLTYKIVANKLEKAEKELAKFNKKMNPGPPEPSKGFSATGALQRKNPLRNPKISKTVEKILKVSRTCLRNVFGIETFYFQKAAVLLENSENGAKRPCEVKWLKNGLGTGTGSKNNLKRVLI